MANKLGFELVSPEKLLVSRDVHMVVIPGTEGDFGVMGGHIPMISAIRPGVVTIYDEAEQVSERLFVSGGFAEVTGDRCALLIEDAVDMSTVTADGLAQEIRNVGEDIADSSDATEKKHLEAKKALLEAQAKALSFIN